LAAAGTHRQETDRMIARTSDSPVKKSQKKIGPIFQPAQKIGPGLFYKICGGTPEKITTAPLSELMKGFWAARNASH